MENSKIIDLMKVPAQEIMKERKVLASVLIAEAIENLATLGVADDLVNGNNVFAIIAGKKYSGEVVTNTLEDGTTTNYKTFDSIKSCMYEYLTNVSHSAIKDVLDYKDAVEKLFAGGEAKISSIKSIIECYKLNEIDTEVINELYSGTVNVIEVNTEKTEEKVEEIKEISGEVNTERDYSTAPGQYAHAEGNTDLTLRLTNENLYNDPYDTAPSRAITGRFKFYNDNVKNGRKPITKDGKYIVGYINVE